MSDEPAEDLAEAVEQALEEQGDDDDDGADGGDDPRGRVLQRDLRAVFGPSPGHGARRRSPARAFDRSGARGSLLSTLITYSCSSSSPPNNVKRGGLCMHRSGEHDGSKLDGASSSYLNKLITRWGWS